VQADPSALDEISCGSEHGRGGEEQPPLLAPEVERYLEAVGQWVTVHGSRLRGDQRKAAVMGGTGVPCRLEVSLAGSVQSGGRIPELISARRVAIIT
jgi:hypothetical protein